MKTHDLEMLTCKVLMTGVRPNLHQGYLLCSSLPSDHLLVHKFHCIFLMKGLVYWNTEEACTYSEGVLLAVDLFHTSLAMVTKRKNLQAFLFLVLKLPSYFDFKLITRILQYLSGQKDSNRQFFLHQYSELRWSFSGHLTSHRSL